MAYYSKYTGAELEERLDKVEEIPQLIAQMITGKDFVTKEDLLCVLKDYAPADYRTIPIDNNTIYWENGVLKAATSEGGQCQWELREHNGIQYLYSRLPVVTQYDVTMYADVNHLDLPNIYDGLPIDGNTIYWEMTEDGRVLKAKFNENTGVDASEVLAIVSSAGYTTQDWINNQNFVTKSFLNSELSKFVTLGNEYQEIEGVKNFLNGIQLGGISIYKYPKHENVLYIDGDVVVSGAITMFAEGDDVSSTSIAEGLPFDQRTIWFNPETQQIEVIVGTGGGGEDGVSNFWELNNIPSWITQAKPTYQYSEIKNTPDLSVYATTTLLNQTLTSYVTNSTLVNTLNDYTTLTYLANELKKYVTLEGNQDIKGVKNFKNGLQISDLLITKLQEDVIYIDANVVVRGGVTMFGTNEVDLPTIKDEIGIAGYNGATGLASFNSSQFSISPNGTVTIIGGSTGLDTAQLAEYLTTNKYATQGWVENKKYLTSHQQIYNLTISKNGTIIGIYTPNSSPKSLDIIVPTKLSELDNDSSFATTNDLDDRINDLINGAPAAYDTLKEIADVLSDNIDSIGDILTTLGTKANNSIKISAGTGLTGGGDLTSDRTLSLDKSGVSAGTYKSVTVDIYGRVTSGYNPTTLSGYGITDAYTKTQLDNTFKLYIPIAGYTEITGEKNFTGGLRVNNSPVIYYDEDNKYWKLEGDLLVTGGVSMYSDDTDFIPSTIMDAVVVDGTSIRKNPTTGALEVIGGSGSTTKYPLSWSGFNQGSYDGSQAVSFYIPTKLSEFINDSSFATTGDLSNYQTKITSSNKLSYSLISGTPTSLKNPNSLKFGSKTYDGSSEQTILASDLGAITSHQTIYTLTFQSGTFSVGNFTANSAKQTINVPTTTSHISEGSNLYFTNARAVSALKSTTDSLASDISTKWTQNDSKISNWDTAFGWGDHSKNDYTTNKYVNDTFVTLKTEQTITGKKNFTTGGLFVNGKQIHYDATNKYWKLEGDLLVTGGVTMYGDDGSGLPSIFDSLPIASTSSAGIASFDSTYFSVNASGKVTLTSAPSMVSILGSLQDVSPSVSGTTNSDVVLFKSANSSTWTTKPLSEIGGGSSGGGSVSGDYLPLSGGTLTGTVTFQTNGNNAFYINEIGEGNAGFSFQKNGSTLGAIRLDENREPSWMYAKTWAWETMLHSGNISSYNAGSATKLQTARTIWGHSFDGTADITTGDITAYASSDDTTSLNLFKASGDVGWQLSGRYGNDLGLKIYYFDKSSWNNYLRIYTNGNVEVYQSLTIGSPYIGNGNLRVGGRSYFGDWVYLFDNSSNTSNNNSSRLYFAASGYDKGVFLQGINVATYGRKRLGVFVNNEASYNATAWNEALSVLPDGNVGIGTESPVHKLHVNGTLRVESSTLRNTYLNLNRNSENGAIYDSTKTALEVEATTDLSILRTYNVTTQANLVLHKNGCVGIGTLSPSYMLDVDGDIRSKGIIMEYTDEINKYGGALFLQHRGTISGSQGSSRTGAIIMCANGGNVGIGTTSPSTKLHVNGGLTCKNIIVDMESDKNASVNLRGTTTDLWQISARYGGDKGSLKFYYYNGSTWAQTVTVTSAGNVTVLGGITMYSDQRKKTILNHVELSLKQIADAPLIEHYYNSDKNKITHVSSIAQYWARLNDWFCKLDNEGFYTMEIQNCALASAISIARHLEKYESKTDKTIRKMKKRIQELEEEVERLKNN